MGRKRFKIYYDGEKVLAHRGPAIYEAKVQKSELQKDAWKYFIHYMGWSKNWDEWVGTDRLLKFTEDNICTQQALKKHSSADKNAKSRRTTQNKPKGSTGIESSSTELPRKGNEGIKHQWTRDEDEKLVKCLVDLANFGIWKGDNCIFRSGYLIQLEKWMDYKIPGCQLRAIPHIQSRLKLLKSQYDAISEMLDPHSPEIGWDDKEKCIVCDEDVFDRWVQSHPRARGLRNKPFPHLEELSAVFGKGQATNAAVECPVDEFEESKEDTDNAAPAFEINQNLEAELELESYPPSQDDMDTSISVTHSHVPNGHEGYGATPRNPLSNATQGTSKKKKRKSIDEELLETFSENMHKLGSEIGRLADCFQFMADEAKRKMQVFDVVSKIPNLTEHETVRAGAIISGDTGKTNYLFSLPEKFKRQYVMLILQQGV